MISFILKYVGEDNGSASTQTIPLGFTTYFPSIVAAVLGFVIWIVVYSLRDSISNWLDQSKRGQGGLPLLITLLGIICGIAFDIIDYSEIKNGNAQKSLIYTGPILVFSGMSFIACVYFTWYSKFQLSNLRFQIGRLERRAQSDSIRDLHVGKLLGEKTSRIRESSSLATINDVRNSFDPASQLAINLGCLQACLFTNRRLGLDLSLKITLYIPGKNDSCMVHCLSTDGRLKQQERDRIARHSDRFKLPVEDSADPCIVTHAATHGGLHIVSDSENLSDEESAYFCLFYEGQASRVRSVFALALANCGSAPYPVLMGHSDAPGSFSDPAYPIEILRKDLDAFADRIALELDMLSKLELEHPE